MEYYCTILLWILCTMLPGFHDCFNIDTSNHRIIKGPRQTQFGYTVQQHTAGGEKWLLVGAPLETNGQHQTGDVYKCPLSRRSGGPSCTKLNLGRISLTNVSERKDRMRLGMTLSSNPKDNSFVACGPLWSYECGSSYYSTGICSRVNASFKFSRTIAPAFQRCETYMDIVIVLDGSNSIYPWNEVQDFLINILRKFHVGPGQIQVGVVQYGEKVVTEFQLNDFRSVEDVVKAASKIGQRGGEETNTALGINIARTHAFTQGGRKGAKKVMIVITDGESHDSPDLQHVIEESEKDGITRYAIAVLGYYNRRGINPEAFLKEIKYIASDPDDKHFFNVTDEAALKDIVDALGERIFSLEGTSKNGTAFGLQMSQAGFSTHVVEDGILVGAVGAYDWNGAVLKETRQGYTVTSVVSARSGQLYVAGAPRFNHTGKVIIFTLKNTGELTILHSLKGQQIGSYYGSEIAPVDLDGDGVTDNLLVAAPMFFSGGWEKGKVYIYRVTEQPRFILEGSLEVLDQGQNARFGSALAPVPDLNGDSFNDVVVGAPLEDDNKGAVYVYHSQRNRILRKYKQRIGAVQLAPGLQFFGRSIHGKMDMNGDGLVDLAVGSLGAAVLLWSRSVVRIHVTVRFEPSKINIFNKDCRRGEKDVTCMSAIVCLNFTARTPIRDTQEIALRYTASIEEKRFNPRAVFDHPDRQQPQNLTLFPGEETCDHIYFHVMETTDYARPIIFTVDAGLLDQDQGPVLDDSWPTTVKTELPFWNGCDEDDHCVPDLVLQSQTDLLNRKQFCAQAFRTGSVLCRSQSSAEPPERIVEGSRRRMVVDVRLENRGENAYRTQLNISYTSNLRFSSLIVKDNSDIHIDCHSEKRKYVKNCNVSAPFMRAKSQLWLLPCCVSGVCTVRPHKRLFLNPLSSLPHPRWPLLSSLPHRMAASEHPALSKMAASEFPASSKMATTGLPDQPETPWPPDHTLPPWPPDQPVTFRLEFEFSNSVLLDHVRLILEVTSEGEEVALHDNVNAIFYMLRYEADLLFTRDFYPTRYELKPDISLEEPSDINPPFNFTFQMQNLGYFPVQDLQLYIAIPEVTKNGNQLLQIRDFHIDQVGGSHCIPPQHVAHSRASPEDLSRISQLNYSNTLAIPVQCTINLPSYRDVSVKISGSLCTDALHALKFKTLELVTTASAELNPSSPMFLHEERPVRHIFLEIRKEEDYRVPIWIIIGSTLGGLLLLSLLILALWKLGFFQRQKRREEAENDANGKMTEER
ncbi:Integrin alpha-11 [Triplophysa tibetana]|uniref:Integrin alpha-11 n=1 Tax=Triplophysa tibetana TaxID=1572043 RepID=A0A5A9PND5_9TELE|nr:Integrin alpha-11 [Triplophysa tibetana]